MIRHSPASLEDLDDGVGDTQIDLLADEVVRDAIEASFVLDVVVDADLCFLPACQLLTVNYMDPKTSITSPHSPMGLS